MAEANTKKMNKGVLIGIIAGVVVIVAAIIIWIVIASSSGIKTTADLRTAISEKKAINCVISSEDDGDLTLQTNEGFSKIRVTVDQDGLATHVLFLEGDGTYYWEDAGTTAFRLDDESLIDQFVDEVSKAVDSEDSEDESYTLKCDAPGKADLKVPSGIDFAELSDFI